MSLEKILLKKRNEILGAWFQDIVESYPSDASQLFHRTQDPFSNPVGHTLNREIGELFDGLCRNAEAGELEPSLEEAIKVRAVQDFTPSKAVEFIFQLKGILKQTLKKELQSSPESEARPIWSEFHTLESRIDRLGLQAFDLHSRCREQIAGIRMDEVKRQSATLMNRLNRQAARTAAQARETKNLDEDTKKNNGGAACSDNGGNNG